MMMIFADWQNLRDFTIFSPIQLCFFKGMSFCFFKSQDKSLLFTNEIIKHDNIAHHFPWSKHFCLDPTTSTGEMWNVHSSGMCILSMKPLLIGHTQASTQDLCRDLCHLKQGLGLHWQSKNGIGIAELALVWGIWHNYFIY